MKLMPALWKRSRRRLFRAVGVLCALVAVTYCMVAVPVGPARASQPITSGGPYTVTDPGGDLVASVDDAGVDPTTMSNFLTTTWPESVGLSPGASLSDLIQATWTTESSTIDATQLSQPPAFSGGSVSVSSDSTGGSTVTVDIPAAVMQQEESKLPDWAITILSQVAGIVAGALAGSACAYLLVRIGGPILRVLGPTGTYKLTTVGTQFCGGLGAGIWAFTTSVVSQALNGKPFNPDFWRNTIATSVTVALGASVTPYITPTLKWVLKKIFIGIANGIQAIASFIQNYVKPTWDAVIGAIKRFFTRGQRQVDEEWGNIGEQVGLELSDFGGPFQVEFPAPAATPFCMDAYGSNGGADPGQIVAVNTCNGNPAQDWDHYPDGMISVWGLCLATGGGTSSSGTALVDLEPCDGTSSQAWKQSGQTLVNGASSDCLEDPGGSTTPGTQLDVAPCNGSPGQNWLPPTAEPCDIYAANGTACVAAYSMTRAMYSTYGGPLYQVKRNSDGTTQDIGLLSTGGDANASGQDSFCAGTVCTITEIYDQSPGGNNLLISPGGGANSAPDRGAVANTLPVKVGGHKAYGLDIEPGTGYRDNTTAGIATNGQPEGMYMVASGTHVNNGCCFDFGNVEANSLDTGAGHMDAVYVGLRCENGPCTGNGPWVEADLENGLWLGNGANPANTGNRTPFVTAMLKNDGQHNFALKGGDSTSGGLSTWYNGALPPLYQPMKQEGAIVMGTGGDNSNWDTGSFFEGVMTAGFPSDAADAAVQANIVAAGYAGSTNPVGGPAQSATASAAGQAVVHTAGATGAGAAGFSSVYTVDPNGDLQESYLPYMGASWITQNLSANYGTPPVMAGTEPVSVVHCGYTSVYTVDAASGDLQETYLPAIGGPWYTQDLSANYGTPPTNVTPAAVEHYTGAAGASPGCGFTSVYTRDRNGDLQETYLNNAGFPGDPWLTQDLSQTGGAGLPGTPQLLPGTSPVAITHCGYTSVYTVDDGSHHLQETYLPSIGGPWTTQDLSANYGTPPTDNTPTAVVHTAGAAGASDDCGFTSVYTVDEGYRHLQETYLNNAGFPGDPWITQDLGSTGGAGLPGTPPVAPGTSPVALVHMGFTSVYTVDEGTDQLQETYLSAIPNAWTTQSLSANYSIPPTDHTPVVLLHPDASGVMDWASVFTVNEFNSHLQESYLPNTGFPGDPWLTHDLSSTAATMPNTPPPDVQPQPAATWSAVHAPNTSAFTVDASNGHLQESYVTAIGQSWNTQDLSAISSPATPPVALRSTPAALFHSGYTSVYTVDAGSYDLQETYLPVLGGPWHSQDLSGNYHTPQVEADTNPAAVVHDGFVSVFTFDKGSGDLQETYLPSAGFPGDAWLTHDLSALGHTPAPMAGTSPVALVHDGYVSVYTVDANGDLQETYLPFMGDGWSTQDLSAKYNVPRTKVTPAAVVHDGYVSVFTIDYNGDLQENYLPFMGDNWYSQDLTSQFHVPQDINVAPAALYHDGYTSVYYHTGPDDHLVEAYLPAISGSWGSQDMSASYTTPGSVQSPSALVHYAPDGGLTWASVYTTDFSNGDLQETYLPDQGFPGNSWISQDLSASYHTPPVQQPGGTLYTPSSSVENIGYVRMVRLQHAGIDNGSLLATFEHSNGPGGMGDYIIRQSFDDGATWSSLSTVTGGGDVYDYAPFLYEFPKQLGSHPAGTLMLLGDTLNGTQTNSRIVEWLSFDHGATWTYKGVVQSSNSGPGGGVWEPFVTLDANGNLVMLFSDERQNSTWSQFIGEIGSADGGDSWSANPDGSDNPAYASGETQVIASPWQADRPGMATVTRLPSGTYVMSYEMCGPHACDAFTKTSPDGDTWGTGPADFGTRPQTGDGLHLQVSPVIASIGNELFLTAHRAYNANGPYPANQTVILTNTSGGTGGWDWIPAPPIPTAGAPATCNTNYSPDMIPAGPDVLYSSTPRDSLIFSTAEAAGPNNCQEVSDSVPVAP